AIGAVWIVAIAGCGGNDPGAGASGGPTSAGETSRQAGGLTTSDPYTAFSLEDTSAECASYRGYTGAPAKATIDCLGRVGPFLYGVNEKGLLERRFDACTTGGTNPLESPGLLHIDRLLSLQLRQATLPKVLKCIPQAYERAERDFVQR